MKSISRANVVGLKKEIGRIIYTLIKPIVFMDFSCRRNKKG